MPPVMLGSTSVGKFPDVEGQSHPHRVSLNTARSILIYGMVYSELIRRYREKSQECVHLQEQLREAVSCETSLQQSMVGLRAEMQALVEENTGLCRALTSSQCEKDTLQAMATNAEVN